MDFQAGDRVCVLSRLGLSVIASAAIGGAGDDIQLEKNERLALGVGVSHAAIAAVLARSDLASGERLVAFSLASFADRDNRAWPGTPAAAARAGLSRSRYLQTRDGLVRRGLLVVDGHAAGRRRASTIVLAFAVGGPWWEGEVNVELLETVLAYSSARGPARLLLAAMAAVCDELGEVRDLSAEQLSAAAGIADRSYRRARQELLATGAIVLVSGVGGRGNTNVWTVMDPPRREAGPVRDPPRPGAPPPGARPLIATAGGSGTAVVVPLQMLKRAVRVRRYRWRTVRS
jgi:hypothetical protein